MSKVLYVSNLKYDLPIKSRNFMMTKKICKTFVIPLREKAKYI